MAEGTRCGQVPLWSWLELLLWKQAEEEGALGVWRSVSAGAETKLLSVVRMSQEHTAIS